MSDAKALLSLLGCLLVAGCQNFGVGGTGEIVVPQQRVQTIESLDLSACATTQPASEPATQPAPQELAITLEQVRQMALANNLDLKVEMLNPAISQASLDEEQARFEALFTAGVDYSVTDTPTASRLSGSQNKNLSITPGIEFPLRTGGTVRLGLPLNRSETDNEFSTLNPAYSSDLSASITQPLLRGGGVQTNAHGIRIAFYNHQINLARTKLEVIRVLAAAERVYWRLYAARQELEVRKKEHDLAVAQLHRARRLVRLGAAAEVEIIRAESGVADTLEAIIVAENAVRDRQRELKRLINQPGLEMDTPTVLIPATPPSAQAYRLDPVKLVDAAMRQRMEMLELELRIAQETSNVAFARNGALPVVTLDYAYSVNGLGPAWDDSFNMISDANFQDHHLGLRMEVPIGNQAARSRLRRALANRMQALASKQQRAATIQQEVYNAIDQLQANWQRIMACRKRVMLAARVLEAEVRQFEQQLRTSTDVLDAQTRLANAQSAEIAAVTEYQIAKVDLAFATGMLLGASRVSWQAIPIPQ